MRGRLVDSSHTFDHVHFTHTGTRVPVFISITQGDRLCCGGNHLETRRRLTTQLTQHHQLPRTNAWHGPIQCRWSQRNSVQFIFLSTSLPVGLQAWSKPWLAAPPVLRLLARKGSKASTSSVSEKQAWSGTRYNWRWCPVDGAAGQKSDRPGPNSATAESPVALSAMQQFLCLSLSCPAASATVRLHGTYRSWHLTTT